MASSQPGRVPPHGEDRLNLTSGRTFSFAATGVTSTTAVTAPKIIRDAACVREVAPNAAPHNETNASGRVRSLNTAVGRSAHGASASLAGMRQQPFAAGSATGAIIPTGVV